MSDTNTELAERLCALALGRVEWRVQHPVDKCYCISFSRWMDSVIDPEQDAREWLANFQKSWPNHPHAKYEVAEVRSFSELEQVALAAAAALREQPPSVQGWIPVAERLPDVKPCGEPGCEYCSTGKCCDSVLVLYPPNYINGGSRFQVCATAYLRGPHFHGEISHWMPLPPAPPSGVAVPIPPGECTAPNCNCEPGFCLQREPATFTASMQAAPFEPCPYASHCNEEGYCADGCEIRQRIEDAKASGGVPAAQRREARGNAGAYPERPRNFQPKPVAQVLSEIDDHLQSLMHYGHSRDLREAMDTVAQLQDVVRFLVHWHDQLTPADVQRAKAVMAKAGGAS